MVEELLKRRVTEKGLANFECEIATPHEPGKLSLIFL